MYFDDGIVENLEKVQQLDFMITKLENRRTSALREIDRRRAAALRLEAILDK
jgi:hypothetical protein